MKCFVTTLKLKLETNESKQNNIHIISISTNIAQSILSLACWFESWGLLKYFYIHLKLVHFLLLQSPSL